MDFGSVPNTRILEWLGTQNIFKRGLNPTQVSKQAPGFPNENNAKGTHLGGKACQKGAPECYTHSEV